MIHKAKYPCFPMILGDTYVESLKCKGVGNRLRRGVQVAQFHTVGDGNPRYGDGGKEAVTWTGSSLGSQVLKNLSSQVLRGQSTQEQEGGEAYPGGTFRTGYLLERAQKIPAVWEQL